MEKKGLDNNSPGNESKKSTTKPPKKGEGGFWYDANGLPLSVSASDLERHTYCPLSWKLARDGFSGSGDAIEQGKIKHKQIQKEMREYQENDKNARKQMIVWSWWFAIVVTLAFDSIGFFLLGDGIISTNELANIARYLALLSLIWLILAIILLFLPWRKILGGWVGYSSPPHPKEFEDSEVNLIDFENDGEIGGWMEGGKVEVAIILGSIAIALHGYMLFEAQERSIATAVLIILTLTWTLFSAIQLQRVLKTTNIVSEQSDQLGIEIGSTITYNDDGITSDLLIDNKTGIRGRPDQIIIIGNDVVPVEQKTGKTPLSPHKSHVMQLYAYLHLISEITNNKANYGIIRYGQEDIHKIQWDDEKKKELMEQTQEIQRLMVEGGAKRNHERRGKCKNCSRRKNCPEPLV